MKILSIIDNGLEHTWDVSVPDGEEYLLPNGVVSHNTSAQLANATNGIEPPKALVTIKGSKDGVMAQVVPQIETIAHAYQTVWDVPVSNYLHTVSVMQKYVDQSISANTSYNPHTTPVTTSILVGHLLESYKRGIKTLYYNNTLDEALKEEDGCDGACKI